MSYIKIANFEQYLINDKGIIVSTLNNNKLKPRINTNGYKIVTLLGTQLSVHRLVAAHFIPNPYNHPQVNHIDGNKLNNYAKNLEWCSSEQNINHALKAGLRPGYVSYDDKLKYMYRALDGELIADLAVEVGNHPNTLSRMLRQTAIKEGLSEKWKTVMHKRRKAVAIRNLEKINNYD